MIEIATYSATDLLSFINLKNIGYEVMYKEDSGNKTYTISDIINEAHYFDILNTGAATLTLEINDDTVVYTVATLQGIGSIGKKFPITKVEITATDTWALLLRE